MNINPGTYAVAGAAFTVREDPDTRLTEVLVARSVTILSGRWPWSKPKIIHGTPVARFYFNGLGEEVERGRRDDLADMLQTMGIPAALLQPLTIDVNVATATPYDRVGVEKAEHDILGKAAENLRRRIVRP